MGLPLKSQYPGSEKVLIPFERRDHQVAGGSFGLSSHKLTNYRTKRKYNNSQQLHEGIYKNSAFDDQKEILEQIAEIREALNAALEVAYQYKQNEGGEDMDKDKMVEKLTEISTKVGVLEERTKKLEMIPTKEEMKYLISQALQENLKDIPKTNDVKVIIDESIKEKGLSKKVDVDYKVEKAKNAIIITVLGAAGALFTALKLFW